MKINIDKEKGNVGERGSGSERGRVGVREKESGSEGGREWEGVGVREGGSGGVGVRDASELVRDWE